MSFPAFETRFCDKKYIVLERSRPNVVSKSIFKAIKNVMVLISSLVMRDVVNSNTDT